MPIENRNLEPGTKLIATYKKETHHALVVAGEDGKVRYQLVPYDGKEYKSPSSLGTAVTGKSCNGWTFWSVDTSAPETGGEMAAAQEPPAEGNAGQEEQEPEEDAQSEDPASEAESLTEEGAEPQSDYVEPDPEFTESTDRPRFHRVPNQRGVDEGQVRLHCYTCRSSFIVPDDQNPETCPMGHEPA